MIRNASLIVVLIAAVAYVVATMQALPDPLATRFGADGAPNDHMSHEGYLALMLTLLVALPLTFVAVGPLLRRLPTSAVNIPRRDHWLAPERRTASLAALENFLRVYAHAMALFLVVVHGLVAAANRSAPPHLDGTALLLTVGGFVLFTTAWIVVLHRRFGRPG